MRSLRFSLSVAALVAATGVPALANPAPAEDASADITGSITAPAATYFQMAPVAGAGNAATRSVHYRLPQDVRQLRLEGEMAIRDMAIYIRPEQAADPARVKIRYINSVAIMPEVSRMTIAINDTVFAETAIQASTEPGVVEFDLPAGTLEPGYNALRITVQQRHRVDCTIEATDELWTQIETRESGITFTSANDRMVRADDLVAMPLDQDGAAHINIAVPQGSDTKSIDRAIRAAQAIAIRADFRKPRITFSKEPLTTPGIQLLVGTTADLRARGAEVSLMGDSPLVISGRAGGPVNVSVSGATPEDIDLAIERIAADPKTHVETGSAAGLRAYRASRGARLSDDGAVSLADLGIGNQEFNGRLFRISFDVVLPTDFYPADNGKATLFLDGAYSEGLLTTNEAIVKVNGRVVGASRLTRSGGETVRRRAIEMSLKALQPGTNVVQLEIRTTTEGDKDCNPLTVMDQPRRLVVSDQTSFAVPRFARVQHLPNISGTASTGFPFAEPGTQLQVHLPKPDFATLSAAATFLVRTGIAAGHPVNATISLAAPGPMTTHALVVGSIADINPELVARFGLPKEALPASWVKRAVNRDKPAPEQPMPAFPPRPKLMPDRISANPIESDALLVTSTTPRDGQSPVLAVKPGESADKPAAEMQDTETAKMMRGLSAFLQRTIGYSNEQLSFLNGGRPDYSLSPRSKLVVAQTASPVGGRGTWLLLAAPDGQTLEKETGTLVSPMVWNQLSGRLASLDPASRDLGVWPVTSSYHYALKDKSVGNITLFAAGWLSNHIQYYVLVILAICGMFGLFTRQILNRIGARP